MNVSLGAAWEQYIADHIQAGQFNNASEVVRDALRRQQEYLLKLEALRNDVNTGVASVKAGHISRASAGDIIKNAKARK